MTISDHTVAIIGTGNIGSRLAAQGLSNRDIAQQLYLSHRTIGTHLYRIFPKLGITGRGELSSALSAHTAGEER